MWVDSEANIALRGLVYEKEVRPILDFEGWSECTVPGEIECAFSIVLRKGTYDDSVAFTSIIERAGWKEEAVATICRSISVIFGGPPKEDILKTARYWLDSPYPWNTKAAFSFAKRTYETEQWEEFFDLLVDYPDRFDALDLVLSNFLGEEDALRYIQRWTPAVLEMDTPVLLEILEEALRLGRTGVTRHLLEKIPYEELAGHTNDRRLGGNFLHFVAWTEHEETRDLVLDVLGGDNELKRFTTTDERTPSQVAAHCGRHELGLRLLPTGAKGAHE